MGNGYQNTSLFSGVCLPERVHLGVLTSLSALISAETWGCSSKLRASIINGSPGNSVRCVSQKSSGRGGRQGTVAEHGCGPCGVRGWAEVESNYHKNNHIRGLHSARYCSQRFI